MNKDNDCKLYTMKTQGTIQKEIKKILEEGGVSEDLPNIIAKGYISTIKKYYLFCDFKGNLSSCKNDFPKNLEDEDTNPVMNKRFDYIIWNNFR